MTYLIKCMFFFQTCVNTNYNPLVLFARSFEYVVKHALTLIEEQNRLFYINWYYIVLQHIINRVYIYTITLKGDNVNITILVNRKVADSSICIERYFLTAQMEKYKRQIPAFRRKRSEFDYIMDRCTYMELCILREKLNTQQIFETVNIIDLYVSLYVV